MKASLIKLQTAVRSLKSVDGYVLKCGLEIHTQLKTKYKLFSLSRNEFIAKPNTNVSFFDAGLPGTQPKLNPEALLLALRAAVSLDCDIQHQSQFDRKHYFYADQPLGYQITQFHKPLALNGQMHMKKPIDEILEPTKTIRIQQIQIEQDTGRTHYNNDGTIELDLNRVNTPLIELVTYPDFENVQQVRAFIKKYQRLVKHLDICTGELETGAIRVDVNVSVNGNPRVEIKNLRNTTDIIEAIKYEYFRQIDLIEKNQPVVQQTRGWTGSKTILRRLKENTVDYRYLPDSELPIIYLDQEIGNQIKQTLPEFPDVIAERLMTSPYNLSLKFTKFLIENEDQLKFYQNLVINLERQNIPLKYAANWLLNDIPKAFKQCQAELDLSILDINNIALLIAHVHNKIISGSIAKSILTEIVRNPSANMKQLIASKQNSETNYTQSAIDDLCAKIIEENAQVVKTIKEGNAKPIKFLVGQAMKKSKGQANSKDIESTLKSILLQH